MKDPLKAGMILFILIPYAYVTIRYFTEWLSFFGNLSLDVLLVGFACLVLLISYYINYCLDEPVPSLRFGWAIACASGTLLFFAYWNVLADSGPRYRFAWFMKEDLSEAVALCERNKGIRLICQSEGRVTCLNGSVIQAGWLPALDENQVQLPPSGILQKERMNPTLLRKLAIVMKKHNITSLRINREGVVEIATTDLRYYSYVPEEATREDGEYSPISDRWYLRKYTD